MTSNELETLKKQVRTRIGRLEAQLGNDEQNAESFAIQESDESTKLDRKISSAVDSQITELKKLELDRLKANLKWLDGEQAGYCDQCGEEIPFARLQAVPITRMCVQCAQDKKGNL